MKFLLGLILVTTSFLAVAGEEGLDCVKGYSLTVGGHSYVQISSCKRENSGLPFSYKNNTIFWVSAKETVYSSKERKFISLSSWTSGTRVTIQSTALLNLATEDRGFLTIKESFNIN